MKHPSQALFWSAFHQSWPILLTQIAGVVSVILLIDLALDPGTDSREIFEAADLALLLGFTFLFVATLNAMQHKGQNISPMGFPLRIEYSYPVSTLTLTLAPLFYFCVLTQLAVFVPGMIVNFFILEVEVSYLPISFVVFQFTIIPLMLAWWSRNGLACLFGYILFFYLYGYGYLLPDYTRIEDTWYFESGPDTDYVIPLLCTAAMLVLTYFGIRQQRSGETLFAFGPQRQMNGDEIVLRNLLPIPTTPCPTSTPHLAELWKERQLNGGYRATVFAAGGTGIILAVFSIIGIFVPGEHNIIFDNVALMIVAIYLSVCISLTVTLFGVRYKNGVAKVSVHDRTSPQSTAHQTLIRVTVAMSSILISGLVIAVLMWLLGPIFIADFAEMRGQFLDVFDFLAEVSLIGGILRIVLMLVAFYTGIFLFAIFLNWFMLHTKKMTVAVTAICIYIFLLFNFVAMFTRDDQYNQVIGAVTGGHVWVLILAIPLAILAMLRGLLRDWVINKAQLIRLTAAGLVIQVLNLFWLFGSSNYDALNIDISGTQLGYLIMQGFLPLLTCVLILWTSNRIRHG